MSAVANLQRLLVVGGGEGIGWDVTKALLKHSPQARICTFGLREDEGRHGLPKENVKEIHFIQGDIRSKNDRQTVVEHCIRTMAGIDTLVFTAGVINPIQRIEQLEMDAARDTFEVNVLGCTAMVSITYLIGSKGSTETASVSTTPPTPSPSTSRESN